jgi:hypothetical protein
LEVFDDLERSSMLFFDTGALLFGRVTPMEVFLGDAAREDTWWKGWHSHGCSRRS